MFFRIDNTTVYTKVITALFSLQTDAEKVFHLFTFQKQNGTFMAVAHTKGPFEQEQHPKTTSFEIPIK
jgi:hypothetical protein